MNQCEKCIYKGLYDTIQEMSFNVVGCYHSGKFGCRDFIRELNNITIENNKKKFMEIKNV